MPLEIGTHSLHASWGGDTHYNPSNSNVVAVTVTKADPDPTLAVTGTVLNAGQNPTSMVVRAAADATGKVTFYDDVNNGCEGITGGGASCLTLGGAPIQDGNATLTTLNAALGVGTHHIQAGYSGDGHYNSGRSNTVIVTVSNPASPKK